MTEIIREATACLLNQALVLCCWKHHFHTQTVDLPLTFLQRMEPFGDFPPIDSEAETAKILEEVTADETLIRVSAGMDKEAS